MTLEFVTAGNAKSVSGKHSWQAHTVASKRLGPPVVANEKAVYKSILGADALSLRVQP